MLKKRIIGLVAGLALIVAVAGASSGVANSLVGWVVAPDGQAIACNAGGGSGGGC